MSDVAPTPALCSPEAALLSMMIETHDAERKDGEQRVESGFDKLEDLRREMARALEAAHQAEKHSGFWGRVSGFLGGDVATAAQAVAAAAVIVGTGGAAAPAVLATAALVMSGAAKLGAEHGLDPKVCAALALAGAAAGFAAGSVDPGAVSGVCAEVAQGASVTAGAATAGGGASSAVEGHYRAEALRAQAGAKSTEGQQGAELFELDRLYAALRSLVADDARATGTVAQSLSVRDRAHHAVLGHIGA